MTGAREKRLEMSIDLTNVNTKMLLDLVERMRSAQKRYFSTRNGNDLCGARDLERRVDVLIRTIRVAEHRAQNPELF